MAGRIVVGIDGSEHSQRALAFAVAEARTRDATLDIVHVHQHTTNPGYLYGPMAGASAAGVSRDELERHSLELIDRTLGQAPDDVEVQRISVSGSPARRLAEVAEGADLLIVGSRGRGGFTGLLLGSTSRQATAHAPCPVTVVPTTWQPASAAGAA